MWVNHFLKGPTIEIHLCGWTIGIHLKGSCCNLKFYQCSVLNLDKGSLINKILSFLTRKCIMHVAITKK